MSGLDHSSGGASHTARCAVCDNRGLVVFAINGLRRGVCPECHHHQRIDIASFDYAASAMTAKGRPESQASFLAAHLRPKAAALEIGCASGALARFLRSRHVFARYDGVELSPARDQALAVMDRVFDAPLPELLSSGRVAPASYDLILSSHCLEHLADLHREIGAIASALRPGGRLFLEVPNRSGNPRLAFDDNPTHLHFFNVSSLSRLLAHHGLEVVATETGQWHDARYPDSLRVLAQPFAPGISWDKTQLSDNPILAGIDKLIVWGAGKMVDQMLVHFFDARRIEFFVDNDPKKQGSSCMGRPVRPPQALADERAATVLINSLDFDEAVRKQIGEQFKDRVARVISIAELL